MILILTQSIQEQIHIYRLQGLQPIVTNNGKNNELLLENNELLSYTIKPETLT